MNKRKMSFIKTVTSSLFVLSVILPTNLYGNDALLEDSSAEAIKIEEKIDRGLRLALEAIRIAGHHKIAKNVESKNSVKADNKEIEEAIKEKANFHIEGNRQAESWVDSWIAYFSIYVRDPEISLPK